MWIIFTPDPEVRIMRKNTTAHNFRASHFFSLLTATITSDILPWWQYIGRHDSQCGFFLCYKLRKSWLLREGGLNLVDLNPTCSVYEGLKLTHPTTRNSPRDFLPNVRNLTLTRGGQSQRKGLRVFSRLRNFYNMNCMPYRPVLRTYRFPVSQNPDNTVQYNVFDRVIPGEGVHWGHPLPGLQSHVIYCSATLFSISLFSTT